LAVDLYQDGGGSVPLEINGTSNRPAQAQHIRLDVRDKSHHAVSESIPFCNPGSIYPKTVDRFIGSAERRLYCPVRIEFGQYSF
jgi:hypothetical protein